MAVADVHENTSVSPVVENIFAANKVDQDFKRSTDNRYKWRLGNRYEDQPEHRPRPVKAVHDPVMDSHKARRTDLTSQAPSSDVQLIHRKAPRVAFNDYYNSSHAALDELAGGRLYEAPTDDERDVGVMYSFDNPGPSNGSDILSHALGLAVDRFEDNKTKKLIKDEYDVVAAGDEDEVDVAVRTVEDDFEML